MAQGNWGFHLAGAAWNCRGTTRYAAPKAQAWPQSLMPSSRGYYERRLDLVDEKFIRKICRRRTEAKSSRLLPAARGRAEARDQEMAEGSSSSKDVQPSSDAVTNCARAEKGGHRGLWLRRERVDGDPEGGF